MTKNKRFVPLTVSAKTNLATVVGQRLTSAISNSKQAEELVNMKTANEVAELVGPGHVDEDALRTSLQPIYIPPLLINGKPGYPVALGSKVTDFQDYMPQASGERWIQSEWKRYKMELFKNLPASDILLEDYRMLARYWKQYFGFPMDSDPIIPFGPMLKYFYSALGGDAERLHNCSKEEMLAMTFVGLNSRPVAKQWRVISMTSVAKADISDIIYQLEEKDELPSDRSVYWIVPKNSPMDQLLMDEVACRGVSVGQGEILGHSETHIDALSVFEYFAPVSIPWRCYHVSWYEHSTRYGRALVDVLTSKVEGIITALWYRYYWVLDHGVNGPIEFNIGSLRGAKSMRMLMYAIGIAVTLEDDGRLMLLASFLNLVWGHNIIGFDLFRSGEHFSIPAYQAKLRQYCNPDDFHKYLKVARMLAYSIERVFKAADGRSTLTIADSAELNFSNDVEGSINYSNFPEDLADLYHSAAPVQRLAGEGKPKDNTAALNYEFLYLKNGWALNEKLHEMGVTSDFDERHWNDLPETLRTNIMNMLAAEEAVFKTQYA